MSHEIANEELAPRLENYARLLVRSGVALKEGQELVIMGPVERADFIRLATRVGYEAGAGHVTVIWEDDEVSRLTYQNVETAWFEQVPSWKREQLNSLAEQGACFLRLEGTDPQALLSVDTAKPAAYRKAMNVACRPYRDGMTFGRNPWCIAGVAIESWAQTVYPQLGGEDAVAALWDAILKTSRADGDDPIADWDEHDRQFKRQMSFMNDHRFDRLVYTSSNGTDLTVGMNAGHLWSGGAMLGADGRRFFPNIPTEEVFTSPDRMRAEGVVHSALPLVNSGKVVRDFWFRFEGGEVVDFDAAEGREVLEHILDTDDNARRLGECALVSKHTPIRQTGTLFYDTLYDENASCHLALGEGFPECVEGGMGMDDDELLAHGVNDSDVHVDFMVGADDLSITGVKSDGNEVPVFVDGCWAWES